MTKAFGIAVIIFLIPYLSEGQNNIEKRWFELSNFRKKELELSALWSRQQSASKNAFFIDVRWDSTMLGFSNKDYLVWANNSISSIENYLGSHLPTNQDSGRFVFFVRKFWLSDQAKLIKNNSVRNYYSGFWVHGLLLDLHCFYQTKAGLSPLFTIDTVFIDDSQLTPDSAIVKKRMESLFAKPQKLPDSTLVRRALDFVIEKMASFDVAAQIAKVKQYSWEEVHHYYGRRFEIPILRDAYLKKGVYRTFEEFKNNRPSIVEFELQFDKRSDALYIKGKDGNMQLARDIWGYCNENVAYIKKAENYFPLTRLIRSFYLVGFKDVGVVEMDRNGDIPGSFSSPITHSDQARGSTSYIYLYKPFHIEMENGDIY